jgi:hypothetical protein
MGYNVLWKWLFVLGVIWVRNEMGYRVMDKRVYEYSVILVRCNRMLRTKYQYSIENPQKKYSMP